MTIVFSGIQPTGNLHLGNYLGAIKNWQKSILTNPGYNYLFSIVDLHAITIHQDPASLRNSILSTYAMYIACGIEGKNITVFQQSAVSEHAELAWILSCNLQLGYLDRMTQYKEKTVSHKERACLGLYSYPVLMAADILLYSTQIVPVGEDQTQHIELTRDVAIKFNKKYGKDIFTIPKYILTEAKRVMSLKDGTKKMSKSDESDFSRINLLDDAETIVNKIKKAKTGDIDSSEVKNLIGIYSAISGVIPTDAEMQSMAKFKENLAEVIITELKPVQEKYHALIKDSSELQRMLKNGGNAAKEIASKNLARVYEEVGLL